MQADPASVSAAATPDFLADAMAPMARRIATQIRDDAQLDRLLLPSVPATVMAVRELLRDPEADTAAVCVAMSRDPALAARMLRVANSPAFTGLSACNSLQAAVVRLGNSVVDNVMLVFTITRIFSVGKRARIQPHLAHLWKHSARVAALSTVLVEFAPHLKRDVALLAGLVHDIGSVPLLVKAQEYPSVFNNPVLLKHLLKTLHCELGGLVLESWNAPVELIQVVLEHANSERNGPDAVDYVDVVLLANLLSYLDTPDSDAASAIVELPAARKLGIGAPSVADIMARAAEYESDLNATLGGS